MVMPAWELGTQQDKFRLHAFPVDWAAWMKNVSTVQLYPRRGKGKAVANKVAVLSQSRYRVKPEIGIF